MGTPGGEASSGAGRMSDAASRLGQDVAELVRREARSMRHDLVAGPRRFGAGGALFAGHRPVVAVAPASDRPVVPEFKVDQEVAPIPPHILTEHGKKAAVHDPERAGIAAKGVRQNLTEHAERLPGRHHGD